MDFRRNKFNFLVTTIILIFSTNITLTVDVKLLIRRPFDTLKIIGPAKTGTAGPLPTAMCHLVVSPAGRRRNKWLDLFRSDNNLPLADGAPSVGVT